MCGFVGFTGDADQGVLRSMTEAIAHRGPDDAQYYQDGRMSLGFRRLSIIDLEGGRQPIENEDGGKVLVFNGEIYNYRDLRRDLLEAGHLFRTQADSEVVLHGYEEYGPELLNRLRGMFAFVIWDREKGELFGARDFFGIKPLYYAKMGGELLFGSEIKSFLPHPAFQKKLNQRALESYLSFQYSPGPETFFQDVYKLPPAHYFLYKAGSMEITRYWAAEFRAEEDKPLDYWVDEIEKVFDNSVEAHKVSDVEVGSFLSSGVDSSYVACSAHVDKTFTVGFDNGEKYNETSYAKELSELIPVKNISKVISPEEFWGNFPKIQYHMDEPLADPSAVALYFVCNTASQHLKVVLSGEGADEIFGGYNIYKEPLEMAWYDKIPFPIRRAIGKLAGMLPAHRGLNFLVRRGKRLEERFIGNAYMFTEKERKALLKRPTDARSPAELVKPYYDMVAGKDPVTRMQMVDLNMWMVGDILLKADKMSMANSLELRVPFLDKEVMALAGRIPTKYRVNGENTKFAMRKAALRRMPEKWAGKRKLGFPVPTRVWLKEEKYYNQVKEAFLSPQAEEFFHTEKLLQLLDDHRAGKADNSRRVWTVYTFLVWYEEFFIKR
ncbi:asparagine synthase (glutamine-hydrolyzing) [Acutalibacter sp. 1XD8-33]|uniref:asparagine synthase (glutamine-hydrolyzing) n=1 Tax=Acutalibacter sp. 1XD8-33 TaxID=2320081 RepID=UPI000EA1E0B0|nr:asparagine synthase (glutamine-hydrolyzing) [Acutalibacter sp. 1XD8-33]RKJ41542.1 asparagine synthase (glutamine-hydrolyzing) [Acutalibacter sp. 1XD8-33]